MGLSISHHTTKNSLIHEPKLDLRIFRWVRFALASRTEPVVPLYTITTVFARIPLTQSIYGPPRLLAYEFGTLPRIAVTSRWLARSGADVPILHLPFNLRDAPGVAHQTQLSERLPRELAARLRSALALFDFCDTILLQFYCP
jgi:hypothetical protein